MNEGMQAAAPVAAAVEDWTADPATGRSNSSQQYRHLVAEVERLLRQAGGQCLDPRWARSTASLIVAQLVHVHHLAPSTAQGEPG